ncbi:MAG: ATP-binding protein [Bacilli bacterium]|nr:ATP-binding protein [Bacilli bacterium]
MLGKIEKIIDSQLYVKLAIDINSVQNLLNLYVLIQDNNSSYIGEILNIEKDIAIINLIGEYKDNNLISGFVKKPAFSSKIDLISPAYVPSLISSTDPRTSVLLGYSPFYDKVKINANINALFGSHLAIFGSTGSGKSCSFARLMQNLFEKQNLSTKMNLIIFDAYGEYYNAFSHLNESSKYAFKALSSNTSSTQETICIPTWLLDIDDYALLLGVQNRNQITIIEKALRNVNLFKRPEEEVLKYKNSIIANAILDILLSGRPASQIRDQIFSALAKFNTRELNLETIISQPGYNRTLRQCLIIDDNGKINAIELITEFLQTFLTDEICSTLPDGTYQYTLDDFADGLDFALIDEGIWKSERIYDDANILRVRLKSLLNSDNRKYFEYPTYISETNYINNLLTTSQGKKAQILNISIDTLDDRFAKTLVKIYSKLIFTYAKGLENRGSIPFNLFLEEAHRYVQNDSDNEILGYNIFERIAKEGRKYGVLLGLISQRPCELSETCLSQCNNFLLFKMTHPFDIEYVLRVVPNITKEIIERIKTVKPGYCIAFGNALNIPTLVKFSMPNPAPNSDNCKITGIWFE